MLPTKHQGTNGAVTSFLHLQCPKKAPLNLSESSRAAAGRPAALEAAVESGGQSETGGIWGSEGSHVTCEKVSWPYGD